MPVSRAAVFSLLPFLAGLVAAAPSPASDLSSRMISPDELADRFGLPRLSKRQANPRYSSIIAFGDSYSSSNASDYSHYIDPSIPDGKTYYPYAESNGPPALQVVAALQGTYYKTYASPGAFIKGNPGDNSVQERIKSHLLELKQGKINLGKRTLYFIFVGFNPLILDFQFYSGVYQKENPTDTDRANAYTLARNRAQELYDIAQSLENGLKAQGASGNWDYYFVGPPQQDLVPGTRVLCQSAANSATSASSASRCDILAGMDNEYAKTMGTNSVAFNNALKSFGRTSQYYDIGGLWRDFHNNPSKYGFTTVSTSCIGISNDNGPACSNPEGYLYWNGRHPSKAGHYQLALALNPFVQRQT